VSDRPATRGPGPRTRLALLLVSLAIVFALLALSGSLSQDEVRDRVEAFGPAAPLAFIVLGALLTVALFPGPILAGAAGLLFGTAAGTPIAIASATLGASLACLLSRTVAGDAVQELGGPRLIGLAAWISRRGFVSVMYARLAPGVPYNLVNYAAGMTSIPIMVFAAATAIATAPRTFAYVALGGSFGDLGSPAAIAAMAVLVTMGIGGLVAVRRDLRRERARMHGDDPSR
jgi:uncharacterized membrane protein YdjX (TVP38/TMEM64 family)